ncbi:hypothetical protein [Leptolyngbya iicbica]|uniref:hypothetical protein n=1 Tax=Leptolyngbya iicbica TaxID=3161580 RepID=UPI000689432B|nr:hypothetical protein [Leptolyngbya sp. LK]
MASVQKVQAYLAYWFQLGKPIVLQHHNTQCLPTPVFQGGKLSLPFLNCWRQIMENPKQSFLKGTDESIAALLTDEWDIEGCARCTMPLPMPVRGIKISPCPCADLPSWPNETMPSPRTAVCSQTHLGQLRHRLDQPTDEEMDTASDSLTHDRDRLQVAFAHSPTLRRVVNQLSNRATDDRDPMSDIHAAPTAQEPVKKPSEPSALDG